MFDLVNWLLLLPQVIPVIITAASIITALTPTPKDDAWVGKAYKALEWCALVVGKAKEIAPEPDKKEIK
tara:strand:+ start:6087 stop:6293 length:207 start_codon:yes stop_codon:yes gene_type:complete